MIDIINLHVQVQNIPILKGLNLSIGQGEVHAIMGPNGAGKSTLARTLAGHPSYTVTEGEIWFKKQNLLDLAPEERAHLGLFMSFQYPLEIPGVSNRQFLLAAVNAKKTAQGEPLLSEEAFDVLLDLKMEEMSIRPVFKERSLNEGFSGGEKKKNEILQMSLLQPDLAILDETDSGLDIDAMRIVAKGVSSMRNSQRSFLLITHYQRLLEYIQPDFVHVLKEGVIERSGSFELVRELETKGYETCNS